MDLQPKHNDMERSPLKRARKMMCRGNSNFSLADAKNAGDILCQRGCGWAPRGGVCWRSRPEQQCQRDRDCPGPRTVNFHSRARDSQDALGQVPEEMHDTVFITHTRPERNELKMQQRCNKWLLNRWIREWPETKGQPNKTERVMRD